MARPAQKARSRCIRIALVIRLWLNTSWLRVSDRLSSASKPPATTASGSCPPSPPQVRLDFRFISAYFSGEAVPKGAVCVAGSCKVLRR
eukprot:scaffold1661_cov251-Pinguiococcus_pyrenoidosus.AAC.4